jgi:GTP-binding protein HflX
VIAMPHERALLVTVQLDPRFSKGSAAWALDDEARELQELSLSSGCQVVGEVQAKRHRPVAGTFLGQGKLEEIAQAASNLQSQVVIFNHELSPAQQRNIEERLDVKTVDRTQLILDIFAQHAKSQEGKVQVELAQLRYLLPRLTGKGVMLSRLGGGIGTRGPGEQKLEMDRRRIRSRIARLNDALDQLQRRREATRNRRKDTDVPVAALVGYTNAGKTTLLNRLTGATGHVQHQLFTTLDPLARRMNLPAGHTVIVTDTVGFLHQLPHHLIEAFHATLEEARDAHLLLHVLDVNHPLATEHMKAVEEVLAKLNLREKPMVTVLNKCDLVQDQQRVTSLERAYGPACAVSAKTGEGIDRLRRLITEQLGLFMEQPTILRVPADHAQVIASIYQSGHVLRREEINGVIQFVARLPVSLRTELAGYLAA